MAGGDLNVSREKRGKKTSKGGSKNGASQSNEYKKTQRTERGRTGRKEVILKKVKE